MPTDVIIDPSTGQIYWNDSTGSPQSISIKGDAVNAISFVGYSGSFSPGSTPAGASTLVTVNDNSGTDALVPGTSGFNLGSSTLRWNTFATNANLSGTLVVSDNTISASLLTGSARFNGGIAISGNASIGQSLNFYNTAATFYTGFRAGTISANTLYTLPTAFPSSASVLQSDTSGTLSWVGSIGTATTAANINVVSATTSANHPVLFTPATGTASGAAISTEPTFVYNPNTDILSVSGLAVTATTASTDSGTGALRVAGGVGISGSLYVDNSSSIIASFKTNTNDFGYIDIQNRNSGTTANSQLIIRNNDGNNTVLIGIGSTNETFINSFNGSNIPRGFGYIIGNSGGIVFNSNVGGLSVGAGSTLILFAKGPGHRLTLSGTGLSIFANIPSTSTTTGGLTLTGGAGIGGSIFGGSTISAADNIEIKSGKELRLNNSGNTFYTGIKAGANTSNTTYTFPVAFPGAGTSVLQSDTSGTLSWVGVVGTATTATNVAVNLVGNANVFHSVLLTPTISSAGSAISGNGTLTYNALTDILSTPGLAVTSGAISTSTTSGAFQVKGGIGITGNAFIGGTINVASPITIPNGGTNASSFGQSAGFVYYDGANVRLLAASGATINYSNGYYQFDNRVYATSFFAGGSQMPNGSGVAGRVTIWSGNNTIGSDAEFTYDSTTNTLTVLGNIIGIGFTASGIASTSTVNSTTVNTGGLIVSGGAGVAKSVSIGGYLQLFNSNNYTSFVSASTANTVYTLPPTSPATGSSVLQSTSAGVMSWVPASSGGVATGAANRMAYYSTAGTAVTDTYGFEYSSSGTAQTINIFGGAAIGSTIFTVSTTGSTNIKVGIGVSNPQFELEVNGEISATNKSFVINHPTKSGMKLRYGSLEGPENGVYVRGISTSHIIDLPDYWLGLVDYNTITVHLTPIGKNNSHYFLKCEDNKVYIGISLFKKINCFYSIWAERKDIPKLTVEY
jgi:hypothetical protein